MKRPKKFTVATPCLSNLSDKIVSNAKTGVGRAKAYYLIVGPALIGLLGQGGHFPEHHAETPHVRLARELSVL
jgi:hypothetical protein